MLESGKGPKKGSCYSTETNVVQNIWKTRSGGDNLIGRIMREKVVNMSKFRMQVDPAETQLKILTAKVPLPQGRKVLWNPHPGFQLLGIVRFPVFQKHILSTKNISHSMHFLPTTLYTGLLLLGPE